MELGLGIDTGGTYTDSVLYDFSEKKVIAKSKALTTKENLSKGIIESLSALPFEDIKQVKLVSLSTTLATNACVEGKGSRGCLILLGYDVQLYDKLGSRYGLPEKSEIIMIPGSHGQQGQVIEEPDWELLKTQIEKCEREVDAFGVAEYWGIRNPTFEQHAKALVREWTGKPVVGAHELSGEINSLRRASTTLLNARLIPLIDKLIKAVTEGMEKMGVHAPVMVVRGDGTLMSESFAKERPVETLLSGPAASVVGGMKLTDCTDALILDIGGTTSDLAVVRNGLAVLAEEGVDVAGWRTGTRAIKVNTIGLGGDSAISFDKNEELTIGPRKATPLSWLAARWPETKERLKAILLSDKWHTLSLGEFFYMVMEPNELYSLTNEENLIVNALRNGPLSIEDLAEAIDTRPYFLKTERLESYGILGRSSLTPTDIMHVSGEYTAWDTEASKLGLQILASRLGLDIKVLSSTIFVKMKHRLYVMISKYLLTRNITGMTDDLSVDAQNIINMAFEKKYEDEVRSSITTPLPLIGIGAPTHIFLEDVAKKLGTQALITENSSVANAVGAITGSIIGEEVIIIKARYDVSGITGYGCHGSISYNEFEEYEEALSWAKNEAVTIALDQTKSMGATKVEISMHVNEKKVLARDSEEGMLLETIVTAQGVGHQTIFAQQLV